MVSRVNQFGLVSKKNVVVCPWKVCPEVVVVSHQRILDLK